MTGQIVFLVHVEVHKISFMAYQVRSTWVPLRTFPSASKQFRTLFDTKDRAFTFRRYSGGFGGAVTGWCISSAAKVRPCILVETRGVSHDIWLTLGRAGIDGSDAAAGVALNSYTSASELWLEKTDRDTDVVNPDPNDTREPVYSGTPPESIVAPAYTSQAGNGLRKV
ncbi:endonuclease [Caballeronia pedi]|uniref:Endonuclease n=1 Tax=Caballeronia pedi TaxID=1777141 RepID=A0A158A3G3_9BURK|nr:YqaJ viral recombinase family protein [Caballeronia pedi]SAK51637.1 endonuclease [Caballeronia pedi]